MRGSIVQSVLVFVALSLAAAALLIVGGVLGEVFARTVLVAFAAALFSAGLVFFLLRATSAATANN